MTLVAICMNLSYFVKKSDALFNNFRSHNFTVISVVLYISSDFVNSLFLSTRLSLSILSRSFPNHFLPRVFSAFATVSLIYFIYASSVILSVIFPETTVAGPPVAGVEADVEAGVEAGAPGAGVGTGVEAGVEAGAPGAGVGTDVEADVEAGVGGTLALGGLLGPGCLGITSSDLTIPSPTLNGCFPSFIDFTWR